MPGQVTKKVEHARTADRSEPSVALRDFGSSACAGTLARCFTVFNQEPLRTLSGSTFKQLVALPGSHMLAVSGSTKKN